jgi:hypothetical protein
MLIVFRSNRRFRFAYEADTHRSGDRVSKQLLKYGT